MKGGLPELFILYSILYFMKERCLKLTYLNLETDRRTADNNSA